MRMRSWFLLGVGQLFYRYQTLWRFSEWWGFVSGGDKKTVGGVGLPHVSRSSAAPATLSSQLAEKLCPV